jgi:hypothetical protein
MYSRQTKLAVTVFFTFLITGMALADKKLPGTPVFGDDFSVLGLFAENWESTKGTQCKDGKAIIPWPGKGVINTLTLRRIPKGDYVFTADVVLDKPKGPKAGHFGIKLDGWINLLISPALTENKAYAHTAYKVGNEKRSRGKTGGAIPGFSFGKSVRIMVSREKIGKSYKYSYNVDGRQIDSFITPYNKRGTGKIMFYGYRTTLSLDNFQLYSTTGTGSNNLVVNSSFEHLQEGMPLYMRPATSRKLRFTGDYKDFINACSIDTNEKVSGKNSVKMTMDDKFPGKEYVSSLPSNYFSNGIWTYNVSAMLNKPITFSVYLKASEDNFPVKLTIWEFWYKGHSKKIKISKEWQRYSFTVGKLDKKSIVRGIVTFSHPGTVWADDLQIEIGNEPSEYMPSSLDKDKFADSNTAIEIEDDIILKKSDKAPIIDGNIENVWFKSGTEVGNFFLNGWKKPVNKTRAWITCDENNLYLAVRAHVPDISKVKGTKFPHDTLTAHTQDCIEVLLDTAFGRKQYYHLTVNAAGSKTDFGPGRMLGWKGRWNAAARINEKEKSIDYEMQFPLENFAGLDIAGKWGINIGRNDTISNKCPSLTHATEVNFHVPAIFPAIVFPDGITEKYKVGVKDLTIVAGKNADIRVTGTVGNLSGKDLDSEIQILDAATGKLIGDKKITIVKGNTLLSFPVTASPNVKEMDVIVKIIVDGKERSSQQKHIALASKLDLYTRYNYYMNEKNAVLVGSLNLPEANKLTGKLSVADKVIDVKMATDFAFNIPLEGITDGEHQITLDVYNGADKIISGTTKLIKRKFKKGATQIDHQRRCLVVDGKPYLAISTFCPMEPGLAAVHQDNVLKNMLRLHKEMGYRCLMTISKETPLFCKQKQALFDLCDKEGIKVINWSRSGIGASPEKTFSTVTNDNIIGWLIIDEPELGPTPSEVTEAYLLSHQKANPYTPVFMNNSILGIPRRYANLETDILMLDDYLTNRESRKVIEMIDATEMMMKMGKKKRKPAFFFLAGENLANHYREPTYAEQVAQTYGVIIAGARGVSYFLSLPQYPENYRASVDVNRELLELEDVILSLEKTSKASISDSSVKFMTQKLGNKIYIIALNSNNNRSADVEIVLPLEFKYAETGNVKFENRKIKIKNGKIADKFKPLERHVYVIDILR